MDPRYAAWLRICDWLMALASEGMMTDDFPDYDWLGCWRWGDHPAQAVRGALERLAA